MLIPLSEQLAIAWRIRTDAYRKTAYPCISVPLFALPFLQHCPQGISTDMLILVQWASSERSMDGVGLHRLQFTHSMPRAEFLRACTMRNDGDSKHYHAKRHFRYVPSYYSLFSDHVTPRSIIQSAFMYVPSCCSLLCYSLFGHHVTLSTTMESATPCLCHPTTCSLVIT